MRKPISSLGDYHAFRRDHRRHNAAVVRYTAVAAVDAYLMLGYSKTAAVCLAGRSVQVSSRSVWHWLRQVNGISRNPPQDRFRALIFAGEAIHAR